MDSILYKIAIKVLFTFLNPFPCDSICMTNIATDPRVICRKGEFSNKFRGNNTVK